MKVRFRRLQSLPPLACCSPPLLHLALQLLHPALQPGRLMLDLGGESDDVGAFGTEVFAGPGARAVRGGENGMGARGGLGVRIGEPVEGAVMDEDTLFDAVDGRTSARGRLAEVRFGTDQA